MREILLLKQIAQSYQNLNLRYSRLALAFILMLLTAVLEMTGLSILYPVVLAMGHDHAMLQRIFARLPVSAPWLQNTSTQIAILFATVGVVNITKNVVLYHTYHYDMSFAMYYYRNLIRGLYSAYVHKPVLEFRQESSGSLASIICVQSQRLIDGVIRPLLILCTEGILLIGIALLVWYVSPILIVVLITACGGTAIGYYTLLRAKAHRWGQQRMHAAAVLQELVNNTSFGIGEIKIFGKEKYLTSRVYSEAVAETEMFRHLEMYQQGPRFVIESAFVVTFVLCFAAFLIVGGDTSVLLARFSVIAAASFRILPSINRLVGAYSNFSFNVAPGLALMQTITGSRLLSAVRAHEVTKIASCQLTVGTIQLKDIGFRYPGSVKQVLRSVNAIIGRGERIGVTGPSGSGKSTLIDILAGLYSPSEGAVLVNGRVIAEDLPVWRTMIGYVPQTPFIMPGTIRENVAFDSDSTQSNERIWAVLTAVGLADFAAALPHGIETEIGEKGAGLSGGQKQLLCLARALYRQPRILLLDEPTSSLDRMTEEKVLAALHTLPPDTTIIMVSHDEQNFDQFDFVFTCKDEQLILKKSKRDRTVMQQAAV